MATVFNRRFTYVVMGQPTFDGDGNTIGGDVTERSVRGTIQPLNGKETLVVGIGNRNTGTAKVYSSERLGFREQGGSGLYFVTLGGYLYELIQELPNLNMPGITHFKYIASLVPADEWPDALRPVVLATENGEMLGTETETEALAGR